MEPVTILPAQPSATQALGDIDVVRALRARFPDSVASVSDFRGELTLEITPHSLLAVCSFLRDDPSFSFLFLSDVTGVDRFPQDPRFEINYHLLSIAHSRRLRLKLRIPFSNPVAPSVTSIWPTANWHEREIFDLFGIRFDGHPDLRRLLLPDEWEGYPLRKDFPVEGYR